MTRAFWLAIVIAPTIAHSKPLAITYKNLRGCTTVDDPASCGLPASAPDGSIAVPLIENVGESDSEGTAVVIFHPDGKSERITIESWEAAAHRESSSSPPYRPTKAMRSTIAQINARLRREHYSTLGPPKVAALNHHGERPREAKLGDLRLVCKDGHFTVQRGDAAVVDELTPTKRGREGSCNELHTSYADGVWQLDGRLLVQFTYEGSDACEEPEPDWKIFVLR
jgi:hypothetical protein